jgi:hypothetical protein
MAPALVPVTQVVRPRWDLTVNASGGNARWPAPRRPRCNHLASAPMSGTPLLTAWVAGVGSAKASLVVIAAIRA